MAKSYWRLPDEPNPLEGIADYPPSPPEPSYPRKQLPKLCKNYKSYKGFMPPKCSGGEGCQVCWLIYEVKNGID